MNEKKVERPTLIIIYDPEPLAPREKKWLLSYMRKKFPKFFKSLKKK